MPKYKILKALHVDLFMELNNFLFPNGRLLEIVSGKRGCAIRSGTRKMGVSERSHVLRGNVISKSDTEKLRRGA